VKIVAIELIFEAIDATVAAISAARIVDPQVALTRRGTSLDPERLVSVIDDRNDDTRDLFDRTLDRLERRARLSRAIRWARDPAKRHHRIPLGILCLLGGLFWFLPVVGLWLLPVGLVLIAHDVPRLRQPVARFMIWIEARCLAVRQRWPSRPPS
jgi:hypothetical protein